MSVWGALSMKDAMTKEVLTKRPVPMPDAIAINAVWRPVSERLRPACSRAAAPRLE
jgi:hypothetical protein